MAMVSQLFMVLLLCLVPRPDVMVLSYSSGAPTSRCSSMLPGHGSARYTNEYFVTTSSNTYPPGGTVSVTLNGTSTFRGFLLQARDASGNVLGTFDQSTLPSGVKTQTCTQANGAVTHSSNTAKSTITVQWKVPTGLTGSINFRATFVKRRQEYWPAIMSSTLTADTPTTQSTTQSTATTQSTTASTSATQSTTQSTTASTSTTQSTTPSTSASTSTAQSFSGWDCDFEEDLCDAIQNDNDILNWTRHNQRTPSFNTGPSEAFSGSYYLYIETSYKNNNDFAMLTLPSVLSTGQYCLNFTYHMYGYHVNQLSVSVLYTDNGNSQKIWTKTCQQGNLWIQTNFDFLVSMDNAQIVFTASRGNGYASDIAIDAVSLQAGACPSYIAPPDSDSLDVLNCNY